MRITRLVFALFVCLFPGPVQGTGSIYDDPKEVISELKPTILSPQPGSLSGCPDQETSLSEYSESVGAALEEGYAESRDIQGGPVKIHYVAAGGGSKGLVLMIHGAPDFWYTWRKLIKPVAELGYRVVAIDLRGYNKSDKPAGLPDSLDNYDLKILMGDVAAVIRHAGYSEATLIGHDWGGFISWNFAMHEPFKSMVKRLVVLNMLHPLGAMREITCNPEQQKAAVYTKKYFSEKLRKMITPESLADWVADPAEKPRYVEAFCRSSVDSISSYYVKNYVTSPKTCFTPPVSAPASIRVDVPTFFMFGTGDHHQMASGVEGTWRWVNDLTLVRVDGAGHFIQFEAPGRVHNALINWLAGKAVAGSERYQGGQRVE